MVKCPKCKNEIEELIHWEKIDRKSRCSLYSEGLEYNSHQDVGDIPTELEWTCPDCLEILFITEEEVLNFLKGK